MAKDPVCGMEVEEGKICSTFEGKRYCFCCEMCREKFDKNPSSYINPKGPEKKG